MSEADSSRRVERPGGERNEGRQPAPTDGRVIPMATPAIDEAFIALARRADVEELEEFLLNHVGRLRGFLNARFGARLGDDHTRERIVRGAVKQAALHADEAPKPGTQGGVALWLWRIGVDDALRVLRASPSMEEDARALASSIEADAWNEFSGSVVEESPSFLPPLAEWSSEEFISALRRRDDDAWRQLEGSVRSILRLLMRGGVPRAARRTFDTEDVYQSAMFKAFTEIGSLEYRGKDSFHRWLVRVFENRLRDKLRRMGALRRGPGRASELDSGIVDPLLLRPEEVLGRAEDFAAIVSDLATLHPLTQRILVMRFNDKLDNAAIAFELGFSERSVRRRVLAAFDELQELRQRRAGLG